MPDHAHHFDPLSGWCNRCTYREDGRLTHLGDVWQPGREYTPEELNELREKARA